MTAPSDDQSNNTPRPDTNEKPKKSRRPRITSLALDETQQKRFDDNLGLAFYMSQGCWRFMIARRGKTRFPVDSKDLAQAALIALARACVKWDKTRISKSTGRPVTFSSFASYAIRNGLRNVLRTGGLRMFSGSYDVNGKYNTESAEESGKPGTESNSFDVTATVPDRGQSPDLAAEMGDLLAKSLEYVALLSKMEQVALCHWFGLFGVAIEDAPTTGARYGISYSAIYHWRNKAIENLKILHRTGGDAESIMKSRAPARKPAPLEPGSDSITDRTVGKKIDSVTQDNADCPLPPTHPTTHKPA